MLFIVSFEADAAVVFNRPLNPSGGIITSSWTDPGGSDTDLYAYDEFTINSNVSITEVRWRGGYASGGSLGHVFNFTVTLFASIANGTQPLCGNPQLEDTNPVYLAKYSVGSNANETLVGPVAGITMYDYSFVLPTAFPATAGTKYWLRIEGCQSSSPDWGIAKGTGGDGQYFQFSTGAARFMFYPGDTAFTLLDATAVAGAGAVPDGPVVPGTPLKVTKASGGALAMSWGASCLATDTDYEIYEGSVGSFTAHTPLVCTTSGATASTVTPGGGGTYYLIVPTNGTYEGSYGRDSSGAERPAGPSSCLPRNIGPCQ